MSAAEAGLARSLIANERPPPVRVRYFYASQLALDDPLSPVPLPTPTPARLPPRPLSEQDSAAVDKAWNELRWNIKKYQEELEKRTRRNVKESTPQSSPSLRPRGSNRVVLSPRDRSAASKRSSQVIDELTHDSSPKEIQPSPRRATIATSEGRHVAYTDDEEHPQSARASTVIETNFDIGESNQGTTGTPFVRAPSRTKPSASRRAGRESTDPPTPDSRRSSLTRHGSTTGDPTKGLRAAPSAKVPVGASRLHQVALPNLQLQPIYWSPVNDVADVIRATWFYKDSMLPVETDIANLLEAGFINLRPWTKTWQEELTSAVNAGPAGEEKIAHALWPKTPEKKPSSRPGTAMSSSAKEAEETPEAQRNRITTATAEAIDISLGQEQYHNRAAGSNIYGNDGRLRAYKQATVIYANRRDAYLLRPNIQPSAYYGRKPYADYIRKGRKMGIAVVRGFDGTAWDRLHPQKENATTRRAYAGLSSAQPPDQSTSGQETSTPRSAQVTDLVLVVHGIGQKLSERVESYNFTYSMNAFRREFNVQLGSNAVMPHLRKNMGGIMVLPVNWRSTLSFEEGGYRDEASDPAENTYSLKDITPDSLPNVRNIVSDVMLDIPYYLSHHQPRMIQAVIDEANRIYALWCKNNPGFSKWGRVHIIAHSLGSVMAIDILSKQPTRIDSPSTILDSFEQEHFAFNTTNLFLAGSPAGFFLLLRKAGLRPRAAHENLLSNATDTDFGVGDEAGVYGCIAVENVYNILNPYDPVSYRLNAAVDKAYAASLTPTTIPSAATSWFSFGSSARSGYSRTNSSIRRDRPELTHRFPSNVELETHNFTREEIAEKRAFLLNDNGQIDYFLRYGGGPLEIQYLTMLGAHSSYWTSVDFIRFLVIEVGREPGRESALDALKASKKRNLVS